MASENRAIRPAAADLRLGRVDAVWTPGGVRLTAPDWDGTAQRLKGLLFGRHEASWYGQNATVERTPFGEGLLVSPLLAADYMADPAPVRMLEVRWGEGAQTLTGLARLIRQALLEGWYAPDPNRWFAGGRGWTIRFPEAAADEAARWRELIGAAAEMGMTGIGEWLSAALEELLNVDEAVRKAFDRVLRGTGAGVAEPAAVDEDDWLVAIGWKRDDAPFRIALKLCEPGDAQPDWTLAAALQDRNEPDRRLDLVRHGEEWLPAVPGAAVPEEWQPELQRRLGREEAKWLRLMPDWAELPSPARLRTRLSEEEAWYFLEEASTRLLQSGCAVALPGWWEAVRSRKLRLRAKVKSSVGSAEQPMFGLDQIVQFDWKLAVGGHELSEEEFMRIALENRRLLKVREEWIHLDPSDLDLLREWIRKAGRKRGMTFRDMLELHLRGGGEEEEDRDGDRLRMEVELNRHLTQWLDRLRGQEELPLVAKPAGFRGELRPYQLEGVSWLAFLRRFGLGGCLADDMGLGKTIQFMAYLLHVKECGEQTGPSLLVCPTSVLGNWEKELQRFAPSLRLHIHYGPRRLKGGAFREAAEGADLVLTSYALAPLDEEELSLVEWDALCLDEAQNIKNVYTKQAKAIRRLGARHRIAMTGTPMENRLTELWSIHDFMNPGYLGTLGEFRREVVQPIERTRDEELIRRVQAWVRPFMLRRDKKDPAIRLSLPDKNETKTYVSLTAEQGALYENTVGELLEKLGTLDPMQRRGLILAALMRLKMLCDHPSLVLRDEPGGVAAWNIERSGKMVRLLEMVDEIAAEGERCLIFTQFVDVGRMLQAQLQRRLGTPVPFLFGAVPKQERDAMVEAFQDPAQPACAFVLSLKAGGTGLNLTAANHVFHFDRWWNPAVENQATDRAFRIGQTKDVQVHKFVTIGTLEERIDDMLSRKQHLNEQVVGRSENWITELSTDELKALFSLRRSWLNG